MLKNAIKRLFPISCIVALLMTAPGMTVLADEMQQKEVILSDNSESEWSESASGAVSHEESASETLSYEESIQESNDEQTAAETESFGSQMNSDGDSIQEFDDSQTAAGTDDSDSEMDSVDESNQESINGNSTESVTEDLTDKDVIVLENDFNQDLQEEEVGGGNIVVGEGVTAAYDSDTGAVELYSNGGTLKKNWYRSIPNTIRSIKVVSGKVYLPADSNYIFSFSSLRTLDLRGFDTSNVKSMGCMFSDCSGLTDLDVSGFDTSNVPELYGMFKIGSAPCGEGVLRLV